MNMNVCQLSLSQHISSMIVAVYLFPPSCPGQRKLVDAMLDCQSEKLYFTCLQHGHSSRKCQRRLSCATVVVSIQQFFMMKATSQDSEHFSPHNRTLIKEMQQLRITTTGLHNLILKPPCPFDFKITISRQTLCQNRLHNRPRNRLPL